MFAFLSPSHHLGTFQFFTPDKKQDCCCYVSSHNPRSCDGPHDLTVLAILHIIFEGTLSVRPSIDILSMLCYSALTVIRQCSTFCKPKLFHVDQSMLPLNCIVCRNVSCKISSTSMKICCLGFPSRERIAKEKRLSS